MAEMHSSIAQGDVQNHLPAGFESNLYEFWQFVYRSRRYTDDLRRRYGKLVTIHLNGQMNVLALLPEAARDILLGDPYGYDAFWKDGFTGVAGPGSIWVLGGERHHRERQLLMPAFHGKGFSGYGEIVGAIARRKTETWQPGTTIRALDTTLSISLEVIDQVVFGIQDERLKRELRPMLSRLLQTYHPLIVFFPGLQRDWFPIWTRHVRAKAMFSQWLAGYLVHRRARDRGSADVLGRMLSACYEDGSGMRDEDIRDELVTILMAGHETTATALAWALYELGRHPEILKSVRAEIEALGPDADPGAVARLPYLSATCNEALRLHTLLPEVARVLVAPLRVLEYTIPAGAYASVSIMAIHHDPELYPEPDRFIPERFLKRTYSPFEFLPFGGGHRRCLGASLSDFEMRIALAEIVTHWDFEPAGIEREIRHDIAMGPKNGVRLNIIRRRNPAPASSTKRPKSQASEAGAERP